MKSPLCVLLPVYNAQHSLAGGVANILEVLPEWSDRFELAIIDDGSQDDTAEILVEVAARFPQVRVLRHPINLGLAEAIQTGLDQTGAEIILIGNDAYQFDVEDLRTLWRLRDAQREMAMPPLGLPATADADRSPSSAGTKLPLDRLAQQLGFQMIRRETFNDLRLAQAMDTIARIDVESQAGQKPVSPRPNLLERLKRLTARE